MTEKKMTRAQAIDFAIDAIHCVANDRELNEDEILAITALEKMAASIAKQAARPKGKTSARIQNEKLAKDFIAKLQTLAKPEVNAKWIANNIPYVMTSQKAVAIAKIAEEWGAITRVTEKKRTYYVLNEFYQG